MAFFPVFFFCSLIKAFFASGTKSEFSSIWQCIIASVMMQTGCVRAQFAVKQPLCMGNDNSIYPKLVENNKNNNDKKLYL